MDPSLVSLLRCPVTGLPLSLVSAEAAARLGIASGQVLLREDGRLYYAFEEHGFPQLLPGTGQAVPGTGTAESVSSKE